jgi:hypothetical protein
LSHSLSLPAVQDQAAAAAEEEEEACQQVSLKDAGRFKISSKYAWLHSPSVPEAAAAAEAACEQVLVKDAGQQLQDLLVAHVVQQPITACRFKSSSSTM